MTIELMMKQFLKHQNYQKYLKTWKNLVDFWKSSKGQERRKRNIKNKSKSKMCHYAGSKSFARRRAELKKQHGKEPDPLDVWLDAHEPKKGSRLDDASAATKKAIEEDLACLLEGSCNNVERMSIFRKHVGEDKNGYAKTFGLGVNVPRSRAKLCALEEERAKRIKSEEQVQKMAKKLDKNTKIMIKLLDLQGMSKEEIIALLSDGNEDEDYLDGGYNEVHAENFDGDNDVANGGNIQFQGEDDEYYEDY